MVQLKVIVVDEDTARREQIKSLLPEYMDVYTSGYGDNAMKLIKGGADGILPNLVILYGDDSKGQGVYIFDWMINKSGVEAIENIPVVVMCDDEFSERSLDFLEIGDVTFYEGEIDEDRLFSVITQAQDKKEFAEEPEESVYEEEKSLDRLMGRNVKITGSVPGKERKVVLDPESQLKNLEAALIRGQKRTEEIRAALGVKMPKTEMPVYLKSITEKVKANSVADNLKDLRDKAVSNPGNAFMAQAHKQADRQANKQAGGQAQNTVSGPSTGYAQNAGFGSMRGVNEFSGRVVKQAAQSKQAVQNQYVMPNQQVMQAQPARRRVIVVDDDPRVTGLMETFLSARYDVTCFNSGMKAIDYFIRNTADLLIIDAVMPGMSGAQTVGSIRYQAGGVRVPVLYLVGPDYQGPREMFAGNYILGILNKPISQGAVAIAVDGFFRGK